MRLIKRLIELAFVILVISLFMKNKDIELQINYFGLSEPIKVAFWELVTFCVSIGIIIAALGDFITQLKWIREKRRMIKTDKGHQKEVKRVLGSPETGGCIISMPKRSSNNEC
jgi:type III secretory pathway component EscU